MKMKFFDEYPKPILLAQLITLLLGGVFFTISRNPRHSVEEDASSVAQKDILYHENPVENQQNLQIWNYKRLLTPRPCPSDRLELVLAIKSRVENRAERNAIRQTWGNETLFKNYPMKTLFLLGKSENSDQGNIAEESAEFGDLLQGDFDDKFQNLALKDYLFLKWFDSSCQSKFIFKGDDDILLNPFLLRELLAQYNYLEDIVIGSILRNSPRISDNSSKYYVSSTTYPGARYPAYVSGGGFVISSPVAKKLFDVIPKLPPLPIDDAFLGLCLKKIGISWRLHNNRAFKTRVDTENHTFDFKLKFSVKF